MDTNKKIQEKIQELDNSFETLTKEDKLDISSLETLILKNFIDYKQIINQHVEELLLNKTNEKELVAKKKQNGKKKDSN